MWGLRAQVEELQAKFKLTDDELMSLMTENKDGSGKISLDKLKSVMLSKEKEDSLSDVDDSEVEDAIRPSPDVQAGEGTAPSVGPASAASSNDSSNEDVELSAQPGQEQVAEPIGEPVTLKTLFDLTLKTLFDQEKYEEVEKLSNSLSDQEKYAEAEKIDREMLALKRQLFGAEHPGTLTTTRNLVNSLYGQGKDADAKEIEERWLLPVLWKQKRTSANEMEPVSVDSDDVVMTGVSHVDDPVEYVNLTQDEAD